jgi:hypothetical protein
MQACVCKHDAGVAVVDSGVVSRHLQEHVLGLDVSVQPFHLVAQVNKSVQQLPREALQGGCRTTLLWPTAGQTGHRLQPPASPKRRSSCRGWGRGRAHGAPAPCSCACRAEASGLHAWLLERCCRRSPASRPRNAFARRHCTCTLHRSRPCPARPPPQGMQAWRMSLMPVWALDEAWVNCERSLAAHSTRAGDKCNGSGLREWGAC